MLEHSFIAVIQGITEFLPVSSSGHIAILENLFGLDYSLFLIIWLHASSLLAVLVYYRKDIFLILKDVLLLLQKKQNEEGVFAFKLLLSTLITIAVGLTVGVIVVESLSIKLVGVMLLVTAGMIYLAEKVRETISSNSFTWTQALLVGVAQGFAVIPGLSRSGTTIAYLVGAGIKRGDAVRISFLLAIPTILGSLVFGFLDAQNIQKAVSFEYIIIFIIGFITSLISIKIMNVWIDKYWKLFIPYCLVLGIAVLLFL